MVKLHYNNYTPVYAYALVPTVGPPSFNVSEGLVYIYTQFKTTVFFLFRGRISPLFVVISVVRQAN